MAQRPLTTQARASRTIGWSGIVLVILIVTVLRAAYLIWLSPFELVADEAHYWDWSRRPSLSYYSKGPGVAWAIGASTSVFGHEEWAVRLPSVIAGMVLLLVLARLALSCTDGDRRAAVLSVIAALCIPAYHGIAMLMTIDGWYVAWWAMSCWLGWIVFQRQMRRAPAHWPMIGLGAALGVGFLFKYTILLLIPGLVVFALLRRKRCGATLAALGSTLAGLIAFVACTMPVVIWNARHDWPTVRHLLGHLGAPGGDMPVRHGADAAWSPMWTLELLGTQLGLVGPMLVLMGAAAWMALRRRPDGAGRADASVFLVCCAAPILLFHLVLSLFTDVEGNWPIAGYATLCVLVGMVARDELARYRRLVAQWLASSDRPRRGVFRRKPETLFQVLWHWSIGFGIGAVVVIALLPIFDRLPLVGRYVPMGRLSGHEARARQVHRIIESMRAESGTPVHVVGARYGETSLLAYYLPGRPTVYSAESRMGGRQSSYDYFPDTDLGDPSLHGDAMVLVGANEVRWRRALACDVLRVADESIRAYAAFGFRGFVHEDDAPERQNEDTAH